MSTNSYLSLRQTACARSFWWMWGWQGKKFPACTGWFLYDTLNLRLSISSTLSFLFDKQIFLQFLHQQQARLQRGTEHQRGSSREPEWVESHRSNCTYLRREVRIWHIWQHNIYQCSCHATTITKSNRDSDTKIQRNSIDNRIELWYSKQTSNTKFKSFMFYASVALDPLPPVNGHPRALRTSRIKIFWSIELNDLLIKKICWLKINSWTIRCFTHLKWSYLYLEFDFCSMTNMKEHSREFC